MAVAAVLVGRILVGGDFFGQAGDTGVMAGFALGDFHTLSVGDLLAVLGAMMTISAGRYFLMLGMGEDGRLRFFGLVDLSLKDHVCRAVVGDDDAGKAKTDDSEHTAKHFFHHDDHAFLELICSGTTER
jgi:hypothetical protein